MNTEFKVYLTIFIISILTPFVMVIFFSLTCGFLIILPVLFFSLVALIISTIGITKSNRNKSKRKYYWITALMAIILFILTYNIQLTAANWMFFKTRENKLTLFVSELKKYDKIKEMSDGQRHWKSVNFTSIETNIADVDTVNVLAKKYFLDDILKRDGIGKEQYEFYRNLLIKTDLIGFRTLEDGTISFTIDGFLDNCYGIAYSETGQQPYQNDCGDIIYWRRIGKNWYAWRTT